ncbi:MAG: hypothetical protein H6932_05235 [Burkholderiaceae bacterium]|nr:hypothetical protein [Burkholderiaceae bacterium]
MTRLVLLTSLVLAALQAAWPARAEMATAFPPAAAALEPAALQARLVGQVFRAVDAQGRDWRMEYSRLGHLFVDVGTGFKDDGPYRVEGSQVCVTLRRSGASCSEYRVDGDAVYLRRASNGEVLTLVRQ